MDRAEFWSIIASSQVETATERAERIARCHASIAVNPCMEEAARLQDLQRARLRTALSALPADEVAAFSQHFDDVHADAFRWDIHGAASILMVGASDDVFTYFVSWLIAQGRTIYDAVLRDPEALASYATPTEEVMGFEAIGYVAMDVLATQHGRDPDDAAQWRDPVRELGGEPLRSSELPKRFPKLHAYVAEWERRAPHEVRSVRETMRAMQADIDRLIRPR